MWLCYSRNITVPTKFQFFIGIGNEVFELPLFTYSPSRRRWSCLYINYGGGDGGGGGGGSSSNDGA